MRRLRPQFFHQFFSFIVFSIAVSIPAVLCSGELSLRQTFTSCGYVLPHQGPEAENVCVEFRRVKDDQWQLGFKPAWFEAEKEYRGSLVDLKENTSYEIRLRDASTILSSARVTTWGEAVPISRVVEIAGPGKGGAWTVEERGTDDGWILLKPRENRALSNADHDTSPVIEIRGASHVILDGFILRGGRHGIRVVDSEYVRIKNCDIAEWGRTGGMERFPKAYFDKKGDLINSDSGISMESCTGIVVERCYIHDPLSPSTSWVYGHPVGPNALLVNKLFQTVVRYNDFIGREDRRWNDVIESGGNFTPDGGFNRDADIYGNYFAFPHDDGIELDGAQQNIRLFENRFEGGTTGVSTTTCIRGPSFIYRNLFMNLGDGDGSAGVVFKDLYQRDTIGCVFYFNNTAFGDGFAWGGKIPPSRRMGRNNVLCMAETPYTLSASKAGVDFNDDWVFSLRGRQVRKEQGGDRSVFTKPPFVDAPKGFFSITRESVKDWTLEGPINFSSFDAQGRLYPGAFLPGSRHCAPHRPLDFLVDRMQILFLSNAHDADPCMLKVTSIATNDATLVVRKPEGCPWFSVLPPILHLKKGESGLFKISLLREEIRFPGLHGGAFLLSQPNGFSQPISVYVGIDGWKDPLTLPPEALTIYASEKGSPQKVPGALKGHAVQMEPSLKNQLLMDFQIEKDGEYYLLLRCLGRDPKTAHNKIRLGVDGDSPVLLRLHLPTADRWHWSAVPNTSRPSPKAAWMGTRMGLFMFKAGRHEVSILPQEQVLIDALVVTPEFDLAPGNQNAVFPFHPMFYDEEGE